MTRSFMAAATQQSNASLAGSCASAALCPTPNVVNNGNGISFGVASFSSAGATTNELQWHWIIPSGFTNTTLTAQVTWRSGVADATKNVVWQAQTACVAPGSADNATFGSAATVTSANNASANVMISATITLGAQAVACATAGNEMYFRLFRTTGGSDTLAAGTADLESVYVSGT